MSQWAVLTSRRCCCSILWRAIRILLLNRRHSRSRYCLCLRWRLASSAAWRFWKFSFCLDSHSCFSFLGVDWFSFSSWRKINTFNLTTKAEFVSVIMFYIERQICMKISAMTFETSFSCSLRSLYSRFWDSRKLFSSFFCWPWMWCWNFFSSLLNVFA